MTVAASFYRFCGRQPYFPFRQLHRLLTRLRFLKRALRPLPNAPWPESEPHKLLQLVRDRNLHRRRWYFPLLVVVAMAALKYRARLYMIRSNFAIRLRPGPRQAMLRDFVALQHGIAQLPETRGITVDLVATIEDDPERLQLAPLFSLFCLSRSLNSLAIYWTGDDARQHLSDLGTLTEQRMLAQEKIEEDLHTRDMTALAALEAQGFPPAFGPRVDPRRTAISYIKLAMPGRLVVAVSLPEAADDVTGPAVERWAPVLEAAAEGLPEIEFCLLNHEAPDAVVLPFPRLRRLRSIGFALPDCIALAQVAHAWFGVLDACGLAAVGARRPGVYWSLTPAANASRGLLREGRIPIWRAGASPAKAAAENALRMVLTTLCDERKRGAQT